jgi:hypothetical protein
MHRVHLRLEGDKLSSEEILVTAITDDQVNT